MQITNPIRQVTYLKTNSITMRASYWARWWWAPPQTYRQKRPLLQEARSPKVGQNLRKALSRLPILLRQFHHQEVFHQATQ